MHQITRFGAAAMTGVALLGISGTAEAVSVTYVLDSIEVEHFTDTQSNGLNILVDELPDGVPAPFVLDDGEWSAPFLAFDIWTDESSLSWEDDYDPQPIKATFAFSSPHSSGTVEGETYGESDLFWIVIIPVQIQQGVVTRSGPGIVDLGHVTYEIHLQNATFNEGRYGLDEDWCYRAPVYAKIKQISSVAAPTPTAALGALAMIGGLVVRRRRAEA